MEGHGMERGRRRLWKTVKLLLLGFMEIFQLQVQLWIFSRWVANLFEAICRLLWQYRRHTYKFRYLSGRGEVIDEEVK